MARYVAIALVVLVIIASVIWWASEEPLPAGTLSPSESVPVETQRATSLEEVGVFNAMRSSGLVGCDETTDGKTTEELQEELGEQVAEAVRILQSSPDPEHLLAAALMAWRNDAEVAEQMLTRAAALDPRHALVASQRLELCLASPACALDKQVLERILVATDKANGIAWGQVAHSRLARGEEVGALAALREAAAAAETDARFIEYAMLFDRALAAGTGLPPFDRQFWAIGHAAAVSSSVTVISRECGIRSADSAEWLDACVRFAAELEKGSGSLLMQMIGLRMQARMYEIGGESREKVAAMLRQAELRDAFQNLLPVFNRFGELRDANIMLRYFDTFAAEGELEAMRYVAWEIEARLPELDEQRKAACETP